MYSKISNFNKQCGNNHRKRLRNNILNTVVSFTTNYMTVWKVKTK